MRILYIVNPGSEKRIYGSHKALFNLINGIVEDPGITIAAVFPREGVFSKKLEDIGIRCYIPNRYRLTISPSMVLNISLIKRVLIFFRMIYERFRIQKDLQKIIDDFKPDIVHTNVGPLDIANHVCKKKNIPHVWHLREYQGNKSSILTPFPSKNAYLKKIHSVNNYMIAITKGVFDHFDLKEKDRIIYDGVFDKKESNNCKVNNSNKDYFLFVGRIDENKDILFLLRSFIEYIHNGGTAKLLLAGAAPSSRYLKLCKNLINKNNLRNKIFFLGFRNDIYELMQNSKALIVTSLFEGFGFITAEAMYNRCLVIGRDLTGTKEQFDNGLQITGQEIASRFTNENELTQCLHKAESYREDTTIENAFNVVNTLYTNQEHCKKIISFYTEILNKQVV